MKNEGCVLILCLGNDILRDDGVGWAIADELEAGPSSSDGKVDDGLLNMVEMAFRAYDPCFGCATHSLPGEMPLTATVRDAHGEIVHVAERRTRLRT